MKNRLRRDRWNKYAERACIGFENDMSTAGFTRRIKHNNGAVQPCSATALHTDVRSHGHTVVQLFEQQYRTQKAGAADTLSGRASRVGGDVHLQVLIEYFHTYIATASPGIQRA